MKSSGKILQLIISYRLHWFYKREISNLYILYPALGKRLVRLVFCVLLIFLGILFFRMHILRKVYKCILFLLIDNNPRKKEESWLQSRCGKLSGLVFAFLLACWYCVQCSNVGAAEMVSYSLYGTLRNNFKTYEVRRQFIIITFTQFHQAFYISSECIVTWMPSVLWSD